MSDTSSTCTNVTTQVSGNISIHAENIHFGQGDIASSSQAAIVTALPEENPSEKCLYQMNRITEKVPDQTGIFLI